MLIKEFLPNPLGKDIDGEWIKLFNDGSAPVDLRGWKIKDASGKTFSLDGYVLNPQTELVLDYKTTKIPLNNDKETIFLFDSTGELVDQLSYSGSAAEGFVIKRENILAEQQAKSAGGIDLTNNISESFPPQQLILSSSLSSTQLFVLIFLIAAILAGLSVWIMRKFSNIGR